MNYNLKLLAQYQVLFVYHICINLLSEWPLISRYLGSIKSFLYSYMSKINKSQVLFRKCSNENVDFTIPISRPVDLKCQQMLDFQATKSESRKKGRRPKMPRLWRNMSCDGSNKRDPCSYCSSLSWWHGLAKKYRWVLLWDEKHNSTSWCPIYTWFGNKRAILGPPEEVSRSR